MSESGQKFITPESIITYTGASIAVWLLSNTARVLFNLSSKWLVFLVSIVVSFISTYVGNAQTSNSFSVIFFDNPLNTIFSTLNACLLFLNSLGLQTTLTNVPPAVEKQSRRRVKWFDPW